MPRPKRDLVRVNFYLQTKVSEGLKKIAALRATNQSDIMRDALRQYVLDALTKEQHGPATAGTTTDDTPADSTDA